MKRFHSHRMLGLVALALACVMLGSGLTWFAVPGATAETQTVIVTSPFTQAIAQVRQSVVGVNNYQTARYSNYYGGWGNYFYGYGYGNGRNQEPQTQEVLAGTGSGTVIAEGYVLTNHHVVDKATRLTISVSNYDTGEITTCEATLVAYDDNLDIAIVYAPDLKVAPVTLGDSDTLMVGDWAICIGNPLGEDFFGTVTTGIVSALNRSISSSSYDKYGRRETITNSMIQTDASINSGNSGGGMFSVTGELMGIPTLKYSGSSFSSSSVEGIGMCIPINVAKPLIQEVLSGRIATPDIRKTDNAQTATQSSSDLTGKPRLGVTVTGLNTSSTALLTGALPNGVLVTDVDKNGPAANAGMLPDDIIVDIDGTVITSVSQMQGIIAQHKEGDTLVVKVYRLPDGLSNITTSIPDGQYVDLKITLAVIDAVAQ